MSNLLERIEAMKDNNGVIASFKLDTPFRTALEEVLRLLHAYYAKVFVDAGYITPANFSIKTESPKRHIKKRAPNELSYEVEAYYETGIPRKLRPYRVTLGYVHIRPLVNYLYLTYAVYLHMRNRDLQEGKFHESPIRGKLVNDKELVAREVQDFCEYVRTELGLQVREKRVAPQH